MPPRLPPLPAWSAALGAGPWLAALVALLPALLPAAAGASSGLCAAPEHRQPLPRAAGDSAASSSARPAQPQREPLTQPQPQQQPSAADYRQRLRPTPYGWPHRDHWCVWIEPGAIEGPAARWDQAWAQAVAAALATWAELQPLTVVEDPEQAQVLVWRRRPPLRGGRASHGRAELALDLVQRNGKPALEPRVSVSISPGQRPEAMEATALHELGHAFGLWGHSDEPADAMAAVPGATPIRRLSARDRATLEWLRRQPGLQLTPALLESWERQPAAPASGG